MIASLTLYPTPISRIQSFHTPRLTRALSCLGYHSVMMRFSQISMREWIALVMFTCISVAALSYGGVCQSLFSSLAFLVLVAMIICAFVGTGELRVYSIGFVVPVIFYLVSIFLIGGTDDHGQLDPSYKLPTTNLFAPLYGVFVKHEYVDSATGAVVENYEGSIVGVGAPTGLGAPTGFGLSLIHI